MLGIRKTLSALLKEIRACFDRIEDPVASRGVEPYLMSGLAAFGMRCASQFDEDVHTDEVVRSDDAV